MGIRYALVAQWIEHWIADPEVDGSTPFGCTEYNVENGGSIAPPHLGARGGLAEWSMATVSKTVLPYGRRRFDSCTLRIISKELS